MNNNFSITRTAGEVRRYSYLMRLLSILVVCLVVVASVAYVISYLYDQFGSFTVAVDKYDMVKQGLSLSESPDFAYPISRLNAKAVREITNISGDKIPADVDMINGSHNGDHYVAYTFYMLNTGEDTVTYEYQMDIKSVTQNVDSAIRVRIYHNGAPTTYARTAADGSGPERGTTEFLTASSVARERQADFKPGDKSKFTVVIWLEGDDPECVDAIVGGRIKLEMRVKIVEGAGAVSNNAQTDTQTTIATTAA